MAAGDYMVRRNNANTDTIPDAGSTLDCLWDTLVASSGSAITYDGVTGEFTLVDTGRYLVMYNDEWECPGTTSNERRNSKTTLYHNGVEQLEGYDAGYIRGQTTDSFEYMNSGCGVIDNSTANHKLKLVHERIDNSTTSTVSRRAGASGITIIKLDDTWDYGRYRTSGGDLASSVTDDAVVAFDWAGFLVQEDTTSFERQTDTTLIRLKSADPVLCIYSARTEDAAPTGRSEYHMRVYNDTAGLYFPGSYRQDYGPRVTDNCDWGGMSGMLILTGHSANDDIALEIISKESGGEDFDGALQLIQLPAGAKMAIARATTGDFNANNTDFAWDTVPKRDTDEYGQSGLTAFTALNGGDHIVWGQQCNLAGLSGATRAVPSIRVAIEDVVQGYGGGSGYNRNSGTAGHVGVAGGGLYTGLSADDKIEMHNIRMNNVTTSITCGTGGFFALSMDSLFGSGGTEHTEDINDTATATDALTMAITKAIADTVNALDNIQTQLPSDTSIPTIGFGVDPVGTIAGVVTLGWLRSTGDGPLTEDINDTVTMSDALTFAVSKAIADANAGITEAAAMAVAKALGDTINPVDGTPTKDIGVPRSESVTVGDAASTVTDYVRQFDDTATAAEALTKAIAKALSENVSAVDLINTVITLILNLADSTTSSDDLSKDIGVSLSEITSAGDVISTVMAFARTLVDTVTADETLSPVTTWARQFDDTATLSDSTAKQVEKAIADAVSALDSILTGFTIFRDFNETVNTSETVIKDMAKELADAVTTPDAAVTAITFLRTFAEVVAVTDVEQLTLSYNRTISDVVDVLDNLSRETAFTRAVADGVSISDAVARAWIADILIQLTAGVETLGAVEDDCLEIEAIVEPEPHWYSIAVPIVENTCLEITCEVEPYEGCIHVESW